MLRLIAKIDDRIINKFAKQRETDNRKINFLKFISNISNGGFIWLLLATVLVLVPDTREYGLAILIGSLIYFLLVYFSLKTTRRKRPYEKIVGLSFTQVNRRLLLFLQGIRHLLFICSSVVRVKSYCRNISFSICLFDRLFKNFLLLHYPTDVLGGAILGSVIGILCAAVI